MIKKCDNFDEGTNPYFFQALVNEKSKHQSSDFNKTLHENCTKCNLNK